MIHKTGLITILLILSLFSLTLEVGGKDVVSVKDESLRKGERRQTLNPNLFNDPMIRKAYQAAKEIPWILDSIYCYCYCEESPLFRHKSLLSCYVDNHAAQ